MAADRTPAKIKAVTDPGARTQATYSDEAQAERGAEAGLNWKPIGALGSAVRVDKANPILVFNSGAAVAYVAFGDQSVAAPTNPSTGIPLLPNEKMVLNSGLDSWIRASAATVFGYMPEIYDPQT